MSTVTLQYTAHLCLLRVIDIRHHHCRAALDGTAVVIGFGPVVTGVGEGSGDATRRTTHHGSSDRPTTDGTERLRQRPRRDKRPCARNQRGGNAEECADGHTCSDTFGDVVTHVGSRVADLTVLSML